MKPSLKQLSESLSHTQQARGAVEALDAFAAKQAAREATLLDTIELSDRKSLAEILELRVVLEIIPRKRAVLEARYAESCKALSQAVAAAWPAYHELLRPKSDALDRVIRAQLAPIFPDAATLERHCADARNSHPVAKQLAELSLTRQLSVNTAEHEPEAVAAQMLAGAAALEALVIPEKL